ncbi:MAG: phosphonatase-like hydrolase [Gemmatimonadales bacterium]
MPSVPIPPPPDLVVCDLAGTTVYDRGEVPAAFAEALREAAVPFDPAEITTWRGASKREVIARLLGRQGASPAAVAERLPRVYGRFHALLTERLARAAEVSLPGVGEAFERLRAAGMRIALTTGFDRQLVQQLLGAVDWAPLLDAWISGDDVAHGRPAPDMILLAMDRCGVAAPERVAVVGDTRLDLEAAWNAGAQWRIGVLTGAHDRATLTAAPHTHLLPSVADIPSLWLAD